MHQSFHRKSIDLFAVKGLSVCCAGLFNLRRLEQNKIATYEHKNSRFRADMGGIPISKDLKRLIILVNIKMSVLL